MTLTSILVLADSAFPTGAFGHSFGLETAIQDERAVDEASVTAWIERYALLGFATLDAAAFVLILRDGLDPLAVDAIVASSIVAAEIRRANAHMAGAALDAFAAMGIASPALARYRAALAAGDAYGVHAVAAALGYAAAGIPVADALDAYVSSALASLVAAASRAIPLGQRSSSRMLWRLRPIVAEAGARALEARTVDDLCTQAIEAEMDGMEHAALEGRMFGS